MRTNGERVCWRVPGVGGHTVIEPRGRKLSFPGRNVMSCDGGKMKLESCRLDVVSMQQRFGVEETVHQTRYLYRAARRGLDAGGS